MRDSLLLSQLRNQYKLSEKDCLRVIQLFEEMEVKKNQHLFQAANTFIPYCGFSGHNTGDLKLYSKKNDSKMISYLKSRTLLFPHFKFVS